MPHEHNLTQADRAVSRAAANNHGSSGISKPAVVPIQRKAEDGQIEQEAYDETNEPNVTSVRERHLPPDAWHVVQQKQSSVSPAVAPIQRQISIAGLGKSIGEIRDNLQHTDDLFYKGILEGVLPVYDKLNRNFNSWDDLRTDLRQIVDTYNSIFNASSNKSIRDIIANQTAARTALATNPQYFASLLTTVGFEHEFAQMKKGKLLGVTHLEIARSTQTLGGLPFILETDAENALELVSPPFLVPTVKGVPLPNPRVVRALDEVMKAELGEVARMMQGWIRYGTLNELIQELVNVTGLTFNLVQNLAISQENITPRSDLAAIGNPNISAQDLSAVEVGKNDKHGKVDSQINFATDIATLDQFEQRRMNATSGESGWIYKKLERQLQSKLPDPGGASANLIIFYKQLRLKLAGLLSTHSQQVLQNFQQAQFNQLQNPGQQAPVAPQNLAAHTSFTSHVKDVSPLWVKDHLMSIAEGILGVNDWPVLENDMQQKGNITIDDLHIPPAQAPNTDEYSFFLQEKNNLTTTIQTAIANLGNFATQKRTQVPTTVNPDSAPGVNFLDHNPNYLGARQDTYIDPTNVQMGQVWGSRLHVVEIRKGNMDLLEELEGRL